MNKVVHFEIPADNLESAKTFYQSVFDWSLDDMPGMNYVMAKTVETDDSHMPKQVGAINGGIMERTEEIKAPVLAMEVDSVDEYIKKVEEAGGKLVKPKMEIGDMGYYAYVTDNQDNVIGLWENKK